MKILALDCDSFAYRVDHQAHGSEPTGAGDGGAFEDCLVLLVTVEPGDATSVGKAIRRLTGRLGTTTLGISGFAHLPSCSKHPRSLSGYSTIVRLVTRASSAGHRDAIRAAEPI